jgi:hypothetical protein
MAAKIPQFGRSLLDPHSTTSMMLYSFNVIAGQAMLKISAILSLSTVL